MPSATRQATPGPGPSTTARSNSKTLKRSHAATSSNGQGQAQDSPKENAPDGREPKKMRMDPNAAVDTTAAPSATTNGRLNARSASVVSSAAENGQQNGERGGRVKNKRKRKKKRTPVVAQASTASVVELVVAPTTHQRLAHQSQTQPSQSQSLPTAGTGNEQSRGKGRERKKRNAKEEEDVNTDGDAAMEPLNDDKEDCDEGGDDKAGNDEPPPPDDNKEDEDEDDDTPRISSSEKGKGKAKEAPSQAGSRITAGSLVRDGLEPSSELATLREELARQTSLVTRHQSHLNQSQQSLTCQICLDLLHRPYALSPCGHVTCYPCLVRWFTAPRNPNANEAGPSNEAENEHSVDHLLDAPAARHGSYIRRSKTCPLCRTVVSERPVEMWTIKAMVASLVRSGLGDLPVPPPIQPEVGPSTETTAPGQRARDTDPWRNIFRRARPGAAAGGGSAAGGFLDFLNGLQHAQPDGRGPARRLDLHHIFGQNAAAVVNANANANRNANANADANANANPAGNAENGVGDPAQMGMFDQEDGIYRCIQCMHEIWNGICTACHRRYPAHRAMMEPPVRGRAPRFHLSTAAATRRSMREVMDANANNSHSESDSEGDDPVNFAVDDIDLSSDDGEQQQREIEDHNDLVMRALMGDDIEDEEDEDDVYGYDALERVLAAEEHQEFGDDDDDEDGEDGEGAFADIPIWHDWGDEHDDEDDDDDMDDFYVHSDDEVAHDPELYHQALEQARAFGEHLRMGGYGYNPDLDPGDSDEEDSQYGGSFIDDNAGPSDDEASSESGTDLEVVAVPPNRLRNNRPVHVDLARRVARRAGSQLQLNEVATESDSDGDVQIVEPSNRRSRAGPSVRTRVIVDDDDDEEEEVEVVTGLRGSGNAASGSGSNSRTRSQNVHEEENARPAPAAAAAAAAMRRAQRFVVISEDEDEPPLVRPIRATRASGSGGAEAGPSGGSRTSRRR